MSLAGKSIVVTGAASGIGRETAVRLEGKGAEVVAVDLRPTGFTRQHLADLSRPDEVDRLVEDLPTHVDGLCNVAGVPPSAPPWLVLAVNAKALQRLTEGLVPKMSAGASIVNVASSAGMGWANSIEQLRDFDDVPFDREQLERFAAAHAMEEGGRSYSFSKEFVVTWTMRHRWTWRDRGIRMNAISPGPVDTPILPDFIATLSRAAGVMAIMDRPATPSDIAPAIEFLLSDDAAWLRGCSLAVDGGLTSHLLMEEHGLA